jgi:hypothetical protein
MEALRLKSACGHISGRSRMLSGDLSGEAGYLQVAGHKVLGSTGSAVKFRVRGMKPGSENNEDAPIVNSAWKQDLSSRQSVNLPSF